MSFEAVFLAGYANLLLLGALGLHRLGRANSSPWAGRVLAGHRRRHRRDQEATPPGDAPPAWPHTAPPRLYTAMATVAAAAALALTAAGCLRHHHPAEAAVLGGTTLAAIAVLGRLAAALRTTSGAGAPGRPPT